MQEPGDFLSAEKPGSTDQPIGQTESFGEGLSSTPDVHYLKHNSTLPIFRFKTANASNELIIQSRPH